LTISRIVLWPFPANRISFLLLINDTRSVIYFVLCDRCKLILPVEFSCFWLVNVFLYKARWIISLLISLLSFLTEHYMYCSSLKQLPSLELKDHTQTKLFVFIYLRNFLYFKNSGIFSSTSVNLSKIRGFSTLSIVEIF
jgi:membrane-bound metal-dependent hydrolase YbcI (DUF457 family)